MFTVISCTFAVADEELLKWGFPEDVWYVALHIEYRHVYYCVLLYA